MKLGKIGRLILIMAIFLSLALTGEAAQKRVAVMEVENSAGTECGYIAADQLKLELESAFVNSGSFQVLERNKLSYCLKELGLQQTGIVESSQAMELGKLSGAQYSVFANVVKADIHRVNNVIYTCLKGKVRMNLKLVDNETGTIVFSKMVDGSKSVGTVGKRKQAPEEQLMQGAAMEIGEKLENILQEAEKVSSKAKVTKKL